VSTNVKILIVTESPAWGGTEVTTLSLAAELGRRGHEVTLAQFGPPIFEGPAAADRLPVRIVTVPHRLRDAGFLSWWRTFENLPADVCVISKGSFDRRSAALDIAARLRYRRYVIFEHHPAPEPEVRTSRRHFGLLPGLGLWWRRQQISLWIHAHIADRVIAVSDTVRHRVERLYGYDPSRGFRVHCGVDPARFRFDPEGRRKSRAEWGVPEHALVIGAISRLDVNKRFNVAVDQFAALARRHPDLPLYFVLAGVGPTRDALVAQAAAQGLNGQCLLVGRVQHSWEALSALDCFMMVSEFEGLGIALLEAMACERACIATNSGGPGEIVTDPSLGWLVPNDDPAALTAALEEMIALPPERRAEMGRRARAHVVGHFDAATQCARLADLVESA
jgi:glycosyltransferase involved in cell wall biosynthesis